ANLGGPDDLQVDPGLQALTDNGGQTPTQALSAGSLAIDHGNDAFATPTDQRGTGFSRILASQNDTGAFKSSFFAPPPLPPPPVPPAPPPPPPAPVPPLKPPPVSPVAGSPESSASESPENTPLDPSSFFPIITTWTEKTITPILPVSPTSSVPSGFDLT